MKELLEKIDGLMSAFKLDSAKAAAGNKAAGTRARKTSHELTKALKEFRSVSIA